MTSQLLHLSPVVAYVVLALLVAGESAGIPLPGETSLMVAALLAATHRLSLPLVVGVAAAGAMQATTSATSSGA
jgi:membrane protein DedA with SNARE-associated domain